MTYREITEQDVGRRSFRIDGQDFRVVNFMGSILPKDVGRRVILKGGVIAVEKIVERDARWERDLVVCWAASTAAALAM